MGTVNVPGIGPVKDTYVWAGVAITAGIVGYAWWRKSSTPADFVGAEPEDYATDDYESPLGSSGTNSTGNYSTVDPNAIDTNGEWTIAAVDTLTDAGWDASSVFIALGKYLARQRLTANQIEIVQSAIAAHGPPPVGGPFPILETLPDPPSTGNPDPDPDPEPSAKLPAPQGFRVIQAWPRSLMLGWGAVSGAKGYVINEVSANRYPTNMRLGEGATQHQIQQELVPGGNYHFTIAALNDKDEPGHTAYLLAHTSKG